MDNIFIQLAIILGISSVFGFVAKLLKLPLLIAYLFGGLVIATTAIFDAHDSQALSFLPDIGVAFVLFLIGMELDLREIKNLGKPIFIAGVLQIIITTILGSVIARGFGFGTAESWYLGLGLSFSSTLVVIKLLLEKKDLTSLYGKLSLGILLLEDLLAVVVLLAMTVSHSVFNLGYQNYYPALTFVIKVLLLFSVAFLLNRYLLPRIFKAIADSGELLFLTALAWCFIYISFAIMLGFSVVIGAFLAGVALASSPYHFQIQGKVKPLRDFFVTLFFVYLGTQVNFANLGKSYPVILEFVAYAILVKPLIFLLILGSFGFRKHTLFQTAINMSQVSEFSLILLLVALKAGSASQASLSVMALTGVISIFFSSIMIAHSNKLYKLLIGLVSFFERKNYRHFLEEISEDKLEKHIIVIGGHRVGGEVIRFLKKEKLPLIVLDFNPEHVERLIASGVSAIYGDMGDPEILDALNLLEARMIISTSQDLEDNKLLLEELKSRHIYIPRVVRAETAQDARILYKNGANLVIIPDILAGDFLVDKLKEHLGDSDYFKDRARIEMEKLSHKTLAWE